MNNFENKTPFFFGQDNEKFLKFKLGSEIGF